jgi:hypothetical protein
MGYLAYYITLAIGVFALALTAFGLFNDLRRCTYPQRADELMLTIGVAVGGWALCVTALQAIFS